MKPSLWSIVCLVLFGVPKFDDASSGRVLAVFAIGFVVVVLYSAVMA